MKAKRSSNRKLPAAIIILLILVAGAVPLLMAMASLCTIPTEVSLSQEFTQSALQSDRSEVDLIELVYNEISGKLAWHGSVDFVGYYGFRYICQPDSCRLDKANVETPVHHYTLCTWERRVRGTIVEVDIELSESRIQTDLYGSKWKSGPKPVWDEIFENIASIKESTLSSLGSGIWDIHHSLVFRIGKIPGGWIASIRTFDGSLIHWVDTDYIAYQRLKEEKQ